MARPLRILLVEDSDDDAMLVTRALRQGDYDVTYERVASAEELIRALQRKWDLIISDFSMPHFSGTDALKMVREKELDTPFIFVSGTIGEETAVHALKNGAQDYIMKSNLRRLLPAVQRELREVETRRERRQLEAQVGQLRRFEAIGRLAGGVAHDFNNMLGAIMGWAEMGHLENPPDTKAHDRFAKISAQAERAAALTRQLLAFARRQVLQPHKTDLNKIVRESVNLLRSVIGERIELRFHAAPDLAVAWADATQIEQVLMNLCLNARDAMPDGGQLTIETENIEVQAHNQTPRDSALPGRYVVLRVSDTGSGMDEETLEHIFEPFFTTKEVGKGTGLGLATVYGIVKQHNGFIYVKSSPGNGAVFTVYLPAGTGIPDAQTKGTSDQIRRGKERILVAEDHEGVMESAREILESLGYSVVTAKNGEEAVRIFEEEKDSIDLVFLNIVMPALNGPDAYDRIRAKRPGMPVIFTTGYATEATMVHTSLSDQDLVLSKPYGVKDLAQKLRKVLDAAAPKRP